MTSFDAIDWDDLKVFVNTARAGNLSLAAKALRIDHSTVSRRIAHLEAALGHPVFERQPTGLRLSAFGKRLLRHAERMEGALVAFREEIAEDDASLPGRVRLATMEGIASLYLAKRLVGLSARHPAIVVELVTSPQLIYVNRREADLFLSFFKPPGQGLVSEKVGRFRLKLYASPAYLARHGTPATPAELAGHRFLSYIDDLVRVDAVRWLDDVVRGAELAFQSNSMIAQLGAAIGGLGLVLLPEFATEGRNDLVTVLPDALGTTRELWLNVHTDLQYSPRIRVVASFLKELFRDDPAMQVPEGSPAIAHDLRHARGGKPGRSARPRVPDTARRDRGAAPARRDGPPMPGPMSLLR